MARQLSGLLRLHLLHLRLRATRRTKEQTLSYMSWEVRLMLREDEAQQRRGRRGAGRC